MADDKLASVYSLCKLKHVLVVAHHFCVSQSIPSDVNVRVLCLAIPPAVILQSTTPIAAFVPIAYAFIVYRLLVYSL